jgi:hypothetical protein
LQRRTLEDAISDAELVEDALLRLGKGLKEDITELRGVINGARKGGSESSAAPAAIPPELLSCIRAKTELLRPITLVDLNRGWKIGKGFQSSFLAPLVLCLIAIGVAVAALPLWRVHAEYEAARRDLAGFNATEFRRTQVDAAYAWVDLRCGDPPTVSTAPRNGTLPLRGMLTTYRDNSFRLTSQIEHLNDVAARLGEIGTQYRTLPLSQFLSYAPSLLRISDVRGPLAGDLENQEKVLAAIQTSPQAQPSPQPSQATLFMDDVAVMQDIRDRVREAAAKQDRNASMTQLVKIICDEFILATSQERNIYRGLQQALAKVYLEVGITPDRLVTRDWVRDLQTRIGHQLRLSGVLILPALFGCLGAIFWSLRRLLDPTNPYYTWSGIALRLVFGALAGVLVSWLFQSGWGFDPARPYEVAPGVMRTPDGTLGVILVGALVVGYSIEVMFVALDRLVELLSRLVSGRQAGPTPPARS